jgi:hypothetical protein
MHANSVAGTVGRVLGLSPLNGVHGKAQNGLISTITLGRKMHYLYLMACWYLANIYPPIDRNA